jgi:uncharacterized protein
VIAKVAGLYVYPVKSCAGQWRDAVHCLEYGFEHDREWAAVGSNGVVVTQRDNPRMALIVPRLNNAGDLILSLADNSRAPLTVAPDSTRDVNVTVWGTTTGGFDQGDTAAEWLSSVLGRDVRLARKNFAARRDTKITMPSGGKSPLTFFDSMPLLVISQASLADLNSRMDVALPMNRFRPSIVLSDTAAFAEDSATQLRIGDITLHRGKPCSRCTVTTIDQLTATMHGPEPLRTLAKYRNIDGNVMFGQYYMPEGSGTISVGDEVEVVG